jgi:hypothetical protein
VFEIKRDVALQPFLHAALDRPSKRSRCDTSAPPSSGAVHTPRGKRSRSRSRSTASTVSPDSASDGCGSILSPTE